MSAAEIGADPAKCQQVRDWPVPRDLHEVRSSVGLCSYYRRHIQGFTELAAPLKELATKGKDFEWTERRHEARGQLKNALTSVPILRFPREVGLSHLDTDASNVGTGAVLSQIQDTGHCLCQQVAGSKQAEELHGPQGAVGGGSGPEALQMLFIQAKDHSQDGQQRRELAA